MFHMEHIPPLKNTPCAWEGRLLHAKYPGAGSAVGATPRKFVNKESPWKKLSNFMAQELRVKSGVWSEKGNFTAKTAYGKTFFIHKNQMAELGYSNERNEKGEFVKPVQYPFYAVVDTTMIGQLDKNGDPLMGEDGKAVQVPRESALSVFANIDELKACAIEERTIGADINLAVQEHIRSKVSTAGLSEQALNNILANSLV